MLKTVWSTGDRFFYLSEIGKNGDNNGSIARVKQTKISLSMKHSNKIYIGTTNVAMAQIKYCNFHLKDMPYCVRRTEDDEK